jgi:hypothetical protein
MSDFSQEFKRAQSWYWWLWLSPTVTIPTLVIIYLIGWNRGLSHLICPSRSCPSLLENSIPIIFLILISGLWHLVLLIPARSKDSAFVRGHGFQMLFLAGIRTLIPILSVLNTGEEEGLIYSIPFLIGIWLIGNSVGQRQAARGENGFLVWLRKESRLSGQKAEVDLTPSGDQDLESLKEIIRFSQDQQERGAARNALISLGLVEYFDGTPVRGQKELVPAETQSKFGLWIFGTIGVITSLCILTSLLNAIHGASNESKYLATQHIRQTATAAVALSSIQSIRTELERVEKWPVVISDSFDADDMGWTTGPQENDSLVSDRKIQNGVYRIETTSTQEFFMCDYPKMDPVSDFYLTVDAREIRGNSGSTFGLIFREKDGSFYAFRTNGSSIEVHLLYSNQWQSLKGNQRWGMIKRAGDYFKLGVLAKDHHFYFFINDEFVGQVANTQLAKGRVGIIIESHGSATQKTFEFDNFELRAP